jgi:DNA modification methylase
MGKKWDYDVPTIEFWYQVYRVLKPGGHILAFGGTRTYHRLAVNIEDAGFEIRDQIQWLYGSGFPKSLNVGKAIDKINGETNRQIKFVEWFRTTGLKQKQTNQIIGKSDVGSHYLRLDQPAIPTKDLWIKLRPHIKVNIPLWVDELIERIEKEREIIGLEMTNKTVMQNIGDTNESGEYIRTKGKTEWEGWGSALKPANEPICLARKPLSEKSIAENVLKWRTGGLNIDGCRIETDDKYVYKNGPKGNSFSVGKEPDGKRTEPVEMNGLGRFPANLILDESAAEMLDKQSGFSKTNCKRGEVDMNKRTTKGAVFIDNNGKPTSGHKKIINASTIKDEGGASRFFYVAKVSKAERNMGLDGFEEKRLCQGGYESNWSSDKEGDIGINKVKMFKNNHPTVKPVNLMSYLCKLITPPNGIVLDPFMGSGSTGIAALLNDFRFVGMEMDENYFKIAEARINDFESYRKLLKK